MENGGGSPSPDHWQSDIEAGVREIEIKRLTSSGITRSQAENIIDQRNSESRKKFGEEMDKGLEKQQRSRGASDNFWAIIGWIIAILIICGLFGVFK